MVHEPVDGRICSVIEVTRVALSTEINYSLQRLSKNLNQQDTYTVCRIKVKPVKGVTFPNLKMNVGIKIKIWEKRTVGLLRLTVGGADERRPLTCTKHNKIVL